MEGIYNCQSCNFYEYDEDEGCFFCSIDLDEDEYARYITGHFKNCPYYRSDDEYEIARKQ